MKLQKFIKSYQELSEIEKAILLLKSLLYYRAPIDLLRTCFFGLDYLFKDSQKITNQELNGLLEKLKNKKFLDRDMMLQDSDKNVSHFLMNQMVKHLHAPDYIKILSQLEDKHYGSFTVDKLKSCRLRLAIYTSNESALEELLKSYEDSSFIPIFGDMFLEPDIELDWIKGIPVVAQCLILGLKINRFCYYGDLGEQVPSLISYFNSQRDKKAFQEFDANFLIYDIFSGNLKLAEQTLQKYGIDHSTPKSTMGIINFLNNQNEAAISCFAEALKMRRKEAGKTKVSLNNQSSYFYILSLFQAGDRKYYKTIQTLLDYELNQHYENSVFIILQNVLWKLQGNNLKINKSLRWKNISVDPLSSAMLALVYYWFDKDQVNIDDIKENFVKYQDIFPVVGKVFAEVLNDAIPDNAVFNDYLTKSKHLVSFLNCVQMGEPWERVLGNLDHYFEQQVSGVSQNSKRLIWYFDPKTKDVSVVEQSSLAKSGWSKGRAISLKRFYELDPKLDYLTEEDHKVIKTLTYDKNNRWYYDSSSAYQWDSIKTPLALAGHQRVYHPTNGDHLELILAEPELTIREEGSNQFHVSLSPISLNPTLFVETETSSRYRLIHFSQKFVTLAEILGLKGINVPHHAKNKVIEIIQNARQQFSIHSEVEEGDVPTQLSDATPCLQLVPYGMGLKINLLVRPFGEQGPYCRLGQGKTSLIIATDTGQLKTIRDFKEEKNKKEELLNACSLLKREANEIDEWELDSLVDCLEILEEIQAFTGSLKIEWPKGKTLALTNPVSFDKLSLRIRQNRDWLTVTGDLKIDEQTVMSLQQVLQLLDQAEGRFIPLGENKFLALTNNLKKQLQDLHSITEITDEGQQLHTFGSLSLKNLTDQVKSVEGDQHWEKKIKSFAEINRNPPQLPTTLQADLRDYQKVGFEWLSRLSSLGLGACLADDMGLGKTVQALAVLLNHAPKGSCLVVAPTSVCHNWLTEMSKFSPTLNTYTFTDEAKRPELIKNLKEMDVLVCSYTMLQQEADLLQSKDWQMIILDEAQAIKNASTKRFKAATQLRGEFKLALSGTPIENNLEEIWSLFRFIAPGLLGSKEKFQKNFLMPIERNNSKEKKNGLKTLIHPFILRRTKNTVLQELPPRIEQTILVESTTEESSFYEALRRQAMDNIANLSGEKGQRKLHILAEITKLRRACCHPSLVEPDIGLSSSKVEVFFELIEDILKNGHQALVFSQYVGYLDLIRQELEKKGISYQYLDGSTPAVKRQQQVQDFQEGKSSLFLLSLKAGGVGLNLTAADYVIHLDPWWNPAVEDQASDRAHRLGQKRPVTIYRLIMQNTIEEKIIQLHKDKRQLADDLLEGSHQATKMSEEDLINLLSIGSGA